MARAPGSAGAPEQTWRQPAAVAVRDRVLRALAVLRVVVLLNALVVNAVRVDHFRSLVAGVAALVLMVAWTGFVIWAYGDEARRTSALLVADLAVAAALILASPVLKGDGMRATVPGFWVMGAMLAWAVCLRLWGGTLAAVLVVACDLSVREVFTYANYGNIFLLLLGGPIVGYLCAELYREAAERDRAERQAAAAAERARLARAVHDGVLQVLALVQRRGAEAGAPMAELARLAAEQESALRSLIRRQDTLRDPAPGPGMPTPRSGAGTGAGAQQELDLSARLQDWERTPSPRTQVAAPAEPVLLPGPVVEELYAAVGECLSNVRHHVAADAHVWVLVEDRAGAVVVSVRDEGPGIPEGRLERAAMDGRLGVAESIRGRLADLGGTATLATGSWGTEWELEVPRQAET